jgi:hypothetical protein
MTGNLFYLQIKRITRSSFWQKNLAINIIIGIFLFFMLLEIFAVGLFMEQILIKAGKGVPPEQILNKILIYYFLITFMMRFFIQELPTMELSPLLHLPIKKSRISLYLNYRSLLSFFNFLPFLLFLPFAVRYLPAHFTAFTAFIWFVALFFFEMSSNFLLIRVKRKSTVTPSVVLIIFGIALILALLEKYDIFSLSVISGWYFGRVLRQPTWALLPLVTAGFFFWENFRYTKNHSYLEDIGKKKKRSERLTSHLEGLENRGKIGALILKEVRLLVRNKRSKQMLFFALPIFLLYGLFFYPDPKNLSHNFLLDLVGVFISGGFLIAYGQYILAWESRHFDFILSANIKTDEFLRAKYYLMTIPTLLLFFLTIPYVYFGTKVLATNTVMLFYNLGINAPLLLFLASFNRKRMELDRGQMMNYQGVGINNFINVIPLLAVPVLLDLLFTALFGHTSSMWIIFLLGITGIFFHRQLIQMAAKFFVKNRYKIAEGYRSS